MDPKTRIRNRGVSLSDRGLQVVQDRLLERWKAENGTSKFTRETRAFLMGLSVATAERVIKGQTVDRATVFQVIDKLELQWDESFVVGADRSESEYPQHEARLTPAVEGQMVPVQANHDGPQPQLVIEALPRRKSPTLRNIVLVSMIGLTGVAAYVCYAIASHEDLNTFLSGQQAFHRGDYVTAKAKAIALHKSAQSQDSAGALAASLRMDADVDIAKGDYLSAKSKFKRALDIREEMHQTTTFASLYEAIGDCELHLGSLNPALQSFEKSRHFYASMGEPMGEVMAMRGLASVHTELGDAKTALSWIDQCENLLVKETPSSGREDMWSDVRARKALAQARKGDMDQGMSLLNNCLKHWKEKGHVRWQATTHFQMGLALMWNGQKQGAKREFEAATQLYASIGAYRSASQTQELKHQALMSQTAFRTGQRP